MQTNHILSHAPCAIFWKDLSGNILGCNETFLKTASISKFQDVINKNDQELPWANRWKDYLESDKSVVKTQSLLTRVERVLLCDREIYAKTTKTPLVENGRIIGIVGTLQDVTDVLQQAGAYLSNNANSFSPEALVLQDMLQDLVEPRHYLSRKYEGKYLTKREAECLICLAYGLTSKETARLLKISFRTIEIYIQQVKHKFNCSTRPALIREAMAAGFLKFKLR
jgi:DNA-binding CsgD family transcriptional regulator